ncbi:MAG: DEAD/DEAH box helicase, partial [Bradymonadaceae bacterium]
MEYRGLTLDRFQEEAVEYIEQDHSVLVAAPTGTGKTLIADYLIDDILSDGGEVVYTAPVKALSNQKYREYTEIHGRENVGLITGDLVINRDAPLRIMTTEILRNVLLEGGMDPSAEETDREPEAGEDEVQTPTDVQLPEIEDLKAVIVDEIHFLDDEHRGTVWEELLIYLPRRVRILGLSATLSNLGEFADWLSDIRDTDVKVVREEERAVPLHIRLANTETGIVDIEEYDSAYNRHRHGGDGGGGGMTKHVDILEMLDEDYFPALYFIFSRSMVERLSHGVGRSRVAGKLGSMADQGAIDRRLDEFEDEHPDVLTGELKSLYRKGIAGHHAGLHVALKALVERLYEDGLLNVVYCTSTFALGINMPARTVVFDSLTKFDGTDFRPLTVREFMQMGGRAGRRGIDPEGDVVIRQDFDDYDEVRPLIEKLRSDTSEPVESSFNLSFHSVVNLLDNHDEERIRVLLERSFKSFQAASDAADLEEELEHREAEIDAKEEEIGTPSPSELGELRSERRELARLERKLAEAERPELWEDFQRKVSFLRTHGYIGDENRLKAPGQILRHIKFAEIFLTELVFRGTLEDREPNELFGILCGLVHDLPRKARVDKPEDNKWWQIFSEIQEVHESDIVQGAADLTGGEPTFTPEMMPLGERWAKGESLHHILRKISNPTDLSGGLVGAFRRGKDLVGQLREVHRSDEHKRR